MTDGFDREAWFNRRYLTLDLASLSDDERSEGSMFLGGSAAEFVGQGDQFEWNQIGTVVFNWGDPQVLNVFGGILEHNDLPEVTDLIPISPSTIIEDYIWSLTLQDKYFDPVKAAERGWRYYELPFEPTTNAQLLSQYTKLPVIGRIGTRWVLFGSGTKVRNIETTD
jgi:hypothetical protein